ncbi:uncharacterized protein EI90DRAFT_3125858 [Cantharellus anzutake]|uniref:uncharacterized protein n=1 Tax=Cantharellus anzutake TaxID=1750568 RepID=UPI001906BE26|nr:uncharacterized protein EI90DRAFT_3125858 [Cantharellus anzutake]KAF8328722.1 hypothetical protein EI90DRAFT_3125858 [Cantharellus anzutake]
MNDEEGFSTVMWNDDNKSMMVKGQRIQLGDVPTLYNGILGLIKEKIQWLSQGVELQMPFQECSGITDDLHNRIPNYSFLSDPCIMSVRRDLLIALGKPKWFVTNPDGGIEWNQLMLSKWMDMAQEINTLFLVAIHLGGGQPARGTEISSILIRNCQNGHRSLFALDGGLTSIIGYNKALQAHLMFPTQGSIGTAAKIPDIHQDSRRGVAAFLWGEEEQNHMHYYLFYSLKGGMVSTSDLSMSLHAQTTCYLRAGLDVSVISIQSRPPLRAPGTPKRTPEPYFPSITFSLPTPKRLSHLRLQHHLWSDSGTFRVRPQPRHLPDEYATPMLPTPDLRSGIPLASLSPEPPVLAPTSDFDPTSAYTHCIG